MSATEIIAFATIGTSIVGMVGFVIGNTKAEATKRGQIYKRIDEEKTETEKTYVRQDLFKLTNEYISKDLKEIKDDVKKLLHKNGID